MTYAPAAAYYAVRPNVHDSYRDVLRAVHNLPGMSRLNRTERKRLAFGVLKEHKKCQMVFYADQKRPS